MERRLTAILAADIVGNSRLIGIDEAGTVAAVKAIRNDLIERKIAKHQGRIVKLMGDGILAEFPSVVNAVSCAVEVQSAMRQRNAGTPPDRCIQFRIGVNLGDVIVEGDDIYGDGVNVAARLEGIAAPGGICISSSAYEQILGKLELQFADLGDQFLKNIARPVRTYAVMLSGGGSD